MRAVPYLRRLLKDTSHEHPRFPQPVQLPKQQSVAREAERSTHFTHFRNTPRCQLHSKSLRHRLPMLQGLKGVTREAPITCVLLIQALLQELHPFVSPCLPLLKVHLTARDSQRSRHWTACTSIAEPCRVVWQANSDHGMVEDRMVPVHDQTRRWLLSGMDEGTIQSRSLRAVLHCPGVF